MRIAFFALFIASLFAACTKESGGENANPDLKVTTTIEFDNIVGGSDLLLNTGNYTNAQGEAYRVEALKYFVSNISLGRADGTRYTVPQDSSYFLINEAQPASTRARIQLPTGNYEQLQFTIGIDSARSAAPISQRSGVLDPGAAAAGMYWTWNSGYIFFLLEGYSPASTIAQNRFQYHIGGFGGYSSPTINNIRVVNISLSSRGSLQVRAGRTPNVHLLADVQKVFQGPAATVSFAANPVVMFNAYSALVANNIAQAFSHDHTEN